MDMCLLAEFYATPALAARPAALAEPPLARPPARTTQAGDESAGVAGPTGLRRELTAVTGGH